MGDAGKGRGRTTHAGTQFEPHMDVKTKERLGFVSQLADFLSAAVSTQQCDQLVLIAPSTMLGELKPLLSKTASKALKRCIAGDLTHFSGSELNTRVQQALQPP